MLQAEGPLWSLPVLPGEPHGTYGRLFFWAAATVDRVGQLLGGVVPSSLDWLLADQGVYWPVAQGITGVLASWLTYVLARSWGADPVASGVGSVLALSAPCVLEHTNSLWDYLAGGLVLTAALHVQMRRMARDQLLCLAGLVEGLLLVGAAFYTRYTSLILLGPLLAARVVAPGPWFLRLRHVLGLAGGTLLLVLPELPRMRVLAADQSTSHIYSDYGAEPVAVMALDNLWSNLNYASLAAFLDPLLGPVAVCLLLVGLWSMWRQAGSSVVRTVGILVGATLVGKVGVSYLNTHPGSRSLFPLFFWAAIPLAYGVRALGARVGRWHIQRRVLLLALLSAGAYGAWQGQQDLRDNWSEGSSSEFDRWASGVPTLPLDRVVSTLKEWGGGREVQVICNDRVNPLDVALPPDQERGLMRGCFGLPIVTWSARFRDFPTLYITEPDDFVRSLEFRRDYFTQIKSTFALRPVFLFDGRVVFTVTPKDVDSAPFPLWTR